MGGRRDISRGVRDSVPNPNCNADSYSDGNRCSYRYCNSYSYCNSYCDANCYSDTNRHTHIYATDDPDAALGADAEKSSNSAAKALIAQVSDGARAPLVWRAQAGSLCSRKSAAPRGSRRAC